MESILILMVGLFCSSTRPSWMPSAGRLGILRAERTDEKAVERSSDLGNP
jgi:hypothetical protein